MMILPCPLKRAWNLVEQQVEYLSTLYQAREMPLYVLVGQDGYRPTSGSETGTRVKV